MKTLAPQTMSYLTLALDAAIEKVEKKKGVFENPKKSNKSERKQTQGSSQGTSKIKTRVFATKRSRYISRIIKRFALARANHQCEHIHTDGARCPSKFQLQFDHVVPFSKGGGSNLENIQVFCRVHNDFKSNY
jgi:5-methylcytosine-specific restriction endonuclease McrA